MGSDKVDKRRVQKRRAWAKHKPEGVVSKKNSQKKRDGVEMEGMGGDKVCMRRKGFGMAKMPIVVAEAVISLANHHETLELELPRVGEPSDSSRPLLYSREVKTQHREGENRWLLTCFYGPPEIVKMKEAWLLLKTMKSSGNEGWFIVGEFNEIITNDEKWGGKAWPEGQMKLFRELKSDGNLYDLGWRGDKYTCSNSHTDATFTKERLDRAMANPQWMNTYIEAWVEVMVARTSDHKPLLVHIEIKIKGCKKAFQRWNKNRKQRNGKEVEEKTKILQSLQAVKNGSNVEEIRKVSKELHLALEKEDLWWKQRAKRNWLFQTTKPSPDNIERCLVGMNKRVTIEMNERLSKRFTSVEVEEAVKQMAPLKASRPDGFGPCFYQNHWGVVAEEVSRAALDT
ncbi:uncharacterized protein LOC121238196 [Juglans microcarpa x Juglans regia]|uniref:uncharacterized protein LOC121238196 n=1 Tax=Juglans microcarpa x Juglans regia TaxID=2249226 RepID=UPI001B7E3C43|nr:uncharacterized protein LOC121238196 [Juglans microcarpa x Juglans regia]